MLSNGPTVIGRLRVRTASQDSLLTQLRVALVLDTAELRSTRLPPSATLCLRTAPDPLPGSLRLTNLDVRPPLAWQHAFTTMLDRLAVSAARPAFGLVPANAQAVVFFDQSELLACLASDWCEGNLTHWWWQSLLKQGSAAQIIKELWRRTPEYVPAAFDQLAKRNKAGKFVAAFSDGEVLALITAVARTFSLSSLLPVLDGLSTPARATEKRLDDLSTHTRRRSSDDTQEEFFDRSAPWDDSISESLTGVIGVERQYLLAISLMLRRAPDTVRTTGFARQFATWHYKRIVAVSKIRQKPEEVERTPPPVSQPTKRRWEDPLAARQAPSLNRDHNQETSVAQTTKATGDGPTVIGSDAPRLSGEVSQASGLVDTETTNAVKHRTRNGKSLSVTSKPGVESSGTDDTTRVDEAWILPETEASQTEQGPLDEIRTQTQFGGAFYLINLAFYLGLYGDFTTPAEPGIPLNIWDFVALVGRRLIGEDFKEDPIWKFLALLALRAEDDEPGASYEPDDEWRMPPEWLNPFRTDKKVHWYVADDRLRLLHSCGFLIFDVPLEVRHPVKQLHQELKAYESFDFRVFSSELNQDSVSEKELKIRNLKPETCSASDFWLDHLLPYFRSRLCLALGLKQTEDPALLLCRHAATVCATATHVNVFLDLANLPLQIRFAGLDRDPGWIPAAGRFLAFHFE